MNASTQSHATTRMFARVIGPFLVIITLTAIWRAPRIWAEVEGHSTDPLTLWAVGAYTLLAGLIVVACHPYWRGAAAILVSVTGWITAIKGLAMVVLPESGMSAANMAMRAEGATRLAYVVFALIGLYLSYVGWAPRSSERVDESGAR